MKLKVCGMQVNTYLCRVGIESVCVCVCVFSYSFSMDVTHTVPPSLTYTDEAIG